MFLDNIPNNYSLEQNDMSQNNESIKPNSEITKDEINTIVNSEALQKAIKDSHDAWEKTKFKWQIFVALVMALSAALGYYLKWDSDRKDLIEQQIQAANERKAKELQAIIYQKIETMKIADNALMNARELQEKLIMNCQYDRSLGNYKEKLQRLQARYEIIKAFTGINFIFNLDVLNRVRDLVAFDNQINNVCALPQIDKIWYQYSMNIDEAMGSSINIDKANLEKLNNSSTMR